MYSKEAKEVIIDTVCQNMVNGLSVKYIFDNLIVSISRPLFYQWLLDEKEYSDKYARASELRSEILFDEIIEIADEATQDNSNAKRLQVDARKWSISKLNPKKYGDKLDVTTDGAKINHTPIFGDNPLDKNV